MCPAQKRESDFVDDGPARPRRSCPLRLDSGGPRPAVARRSFRRGGRRAAGPAAAVAVPAELRPERYGSVVRCRLLRRLLPAAGPEVKMLSLSRRMCTGALVLLALVSASLAVKAGDIFKLCKRNDPQLNECVKESILALRSTFKNGIPELKVNSLDPMVVSEISLNQGSGPVSIKSTFKDLHIKGFTDVQIHNVKVDLPNYRMDIDTSLDWFYTWGDYDIKGQILVLPISGTGPSWSNYTNVKGRATITGHEVIKKNKTYFGMDNMLFDLDVGHATIHMDNLFNGNKVLGDTMNRFMSENWKVVYAELKPVIDEAVSTLLRDVAKKTFDKFPLEELFPK